MTANKTPASNLYLGIMSGTSLDAIDAVIADFSANGCRIIANIETELTPTLREEIRLLNGICDNELERSQILDRQLGRAFAQAAQHVLQDAKLAACDIRAIGCHGQTLRHKPQGSNGFSVQIGSGASIAEITGIDVVNDFRSRDIAAGGQGAPLVPAFHQAVFQDARKARAIINIGGMANATLLYPNGNIAGFDTGPGNVLLDSWIKLQLQQSFDYDGQWARSGEVNTALLAALLEEPFFQLAPPKSTGRELFDQHWLKQFSLQAIASADIQATLLELTAQSICQALPADIDELYLCGGGALNSYLKERIALISSKPVDTTETLGIDPLWVEATAFAWLAMRTINQQPGNSPSSTGAAGPRILGAIHLA